MKMVADKHRRATDHNKHWRRALGMSTSMIANNLENQKYGVLVNFS